MSSTDTISSSNWNLPNKALTEVTIKEDRVAIPAIPMPIAICCCILNFLTPGIGTIVAGLTSLCCSREDGRRSQRCASCCISFGIGLLQLMFAFVFLVGWIWSCFWGVLFLGMSAEYYHDQHPPVSVQKVMSSVVIHQPIKDKDEPFSGGVEHVESSHHQVICTGFAWTDPEPPPSYSAT